MKWKENEIGYLKENYPKNISKEEITKKLNKSWKAIQNKSVRLNISRQRFPSDKPRIKQSRQEIDKRYYLKNKKKIYERKMNRRKILKEEIIQMLGNKCKICGYNKCKDAFDFHHVKGIKGGHINVFLKDESRAKILKEAKKCLLLCANCHRELHSKGL